MANLTSILGTTLISNSPSILTGNFQNLNLGLSSTLTGRIVVSSVAASILSLVTVASDQVIVWAKGTITGSASSGSVALIYDGVTKDAMAIKQAAADDQTAYSLMYSEAPGAATANVVTSIIATGALTITNPKIIIQKIV